MKQIKTIAEKSTQKFDDTVNLALLQGWGLVRRYYTPDNFFVAELEREDETEPEPGKKSCENCRHVQSDPYGVPCNQCLLYGKWEPAT
jgi:hypothetical protein